MSDSFSSLSVRARTCLGIFFNGKYARRQVIMAVRDGSIMTARNLGKKSYIEICNCVGIKNPPPYRHLRKYSCSVLERAEKIKSMYESQEKLSIELLRARGYKVTKSR